MPRIIAKFGYMQAKNKKRSGFLEYIARRSGVIKNLETNSNKPATKKQKELIEKLIKDYPKTIKYDSYKIYNNNQTLDNASELITEIEEDYFTRLNHAPEYLSYIAERPRVQKEGSHGLFTSHDEKIILSNLKDRISNHKGHIWTGIISLKREDAHRLQYEDLKSWKILVRELQNNLAENLQIDYENFEWYGAFHNEAHHPHIHLVMFSKDERQGYLSKQSIDNIRGAFAKEIFKHDLMNIYKKQTHYRDQLKLSSETYIKSQIQNISNSFMPNKEIELRLTELAEVLETTKGKHVYGYLPKPTKKLVDEIVNLVSQQPEVQQLLDLWYVQRQDILNTYTNKQEQVRNLSDLDAFRSIKNMVIKEAKRIDLNDTKMLLDKKRILDAFPSVIHFDNSENLIELNINNQTVYLPESIDLDTYILEEKEITIRKIKYTDDSSTQNKIKPDTSNINQYFNSVRLLYSISNMFEKSMNNQAQKYHADQEILRRIRKQKIALGQHKKE